MANSAGKSIDPVALLQDLERQFASYEFYAAIRRIECAYPSMPRLGKSSRASDEPARLGQVPSALFAPSMFAEAERRTDGRLWLGGVFFGLFGPNGPLPLHLTEYAHDRRHNFRDFTMSRFADIFHHRLLCLFYRGWADAEPTVHYDRPEQDRFSSYLGSIQGIGLRSLRARDEMPDTAKLHFAGRLSSQVRNPEGLRAIIEGFFRVRAQILEFRGEWMRLERVDRLQLGVAAIDAAGLLGVTSILGERTWGAQWRFRIVIGPLSYGIYEQFLPGSKALGQLAAMVRNYVGCELKWELQLLLEHAEIPRLSLGRGARLGWTSWVGPRRDRLDARDLILANVA
jgi:type VI secretion system protein ImpH